MRRPRLSALAASALAAGLGHAMPESSLGLAVFSTGPWVVYGRHDGFAPRPYRGNLERLEFNKLISVGLYGRLLGVSAYAGLPLQWSAKRDIRGDTGRVAPADLEVYLGKRLGRVEVRGGMVVPAGYDTEDGNPWMGPGTVQVTLGAAANPNITRFSRRWETSAEAKWAYALTNGVAKAGTWGLYPQAKVSFRPVDRWKAGGELSGDWKSEYWGKSAGFTQSVLEGGAASATWSAGAVGTLFGEVFLNPRLALGAKAGHSLWGYHGGLSAHGSLYLLYFP